MSHGRTYSEQRYSPLTSINKENVGTLGLAWYADLDTVRGQEVERGPLLLARFGDLEVGPPRHLAEAQAHGQEERYSGAERRARHGQPL